MDVRSLTLRKGRSQRRPQISAPRPIGDSKAGGAPPPPSSSSSSTAAPPRAHPNEDDGGSGRPSHQQRPSRQEPQQPQQELPHGGATSDLVKRRYSIRYNQLPAFDSNAPPVPGVPAIPHGFTTYDDRGPSGEDASVPSGGAGQPLRVDPKALKDPKLPVENYVTKLLANASEQDIHEYQTSLRKLKNRTSSDLQQNVYQNRTQFIKISQEAEKLNEEMNTLRGLMSELTAALGQASATSGSAAGGLEEQMTPASRKAANRSSVANLETMWNLQLQTLWKTVERSQKFLPAIPGRHIVLESGHWVELDSATWKPRRPVHIVLLNDHLLVAAKKRKRVDPNNPQAKANAPTKLVAEECWPLQDIDLIDLGDSGPDGTLDDPEDGVPNAVNVRYGQRSFTYRHDQRNDQAKNDLVMTFRRTVEELRKSLQTETDAATGPKAAEAALNGTSSSAKRKSEILDSMITPRDKLDILIDVDGKQQNMRWVDGQLDDLDMDIALQKFENAVARVERLRRLAKGLKSNMTAQEIICTKVDERASTLAGILLRTLVDTHSFFQATKKNISWLARLGFDDKAREEYLRARTEIITKRSRQCLFEGDLPLYIFQISFVFFTLVRNTVATYQQCFPAPMSSACIKWAKDHLDGFNAVLTRQLSSVELDTPVWEKCMGIVRDHASMLSEVGVDFGDMIQLDEGHPKTENGENGMW